MPTVKHLVRQAAHVLGYDVVSLRSGLAEQQARLTRDLGIDLVVDVGANEGQYAQRIRGLGYHGDLLSVEPGLAAFTRLRGNARHDPRWRQVRTAVGAGAGDVTLHLSGNSVSSSTLTMLPGHVAADPASAFQGVEQVPCVRLDELLADIPGQRLWLKIDTQGTELEVLHGAARTLERTRVVQTELSLAPLYAGQADPREVLELLLGQGFTISALEPGFQDPATGDLLQCDVVLRR